MSYLSVFVKGKRGGKKWKGTCHNVKKRCDCKSNEGKKTQTSTQEFYKSIKTSFRGQNLRPKSLTEAWWFPEVRSHDLWPQCSHSLSHLLTEKMLFTLRDHTACHDTVHQLKWLNKTFSVKLDIYIYALLCHLIEVMSNRACRGMILFLISSPSNWWWALEKLVLDIMKVILNCLKIKRGLQAVFKCALGLFMYTCTFSSLFARWVNNV